MPGLPAGRRRGRWRRRRQPNTLQRTVAIEMVLEDDGEGWPRGSPELVISTMRVFDNGTSATLHCAHEEQAYPYRFDADDGWAGEVLVTPLSDFYATGPTTPVTAIMIWENDDDSNLCAFSGENSWDPVEAQVVYAQQGGYRVDWRRLEQDSNGDGTVDAVRTFLATLASLIALSEWVGNGDDVVGLAILSGSATGFEDPKNIVGFLEYGLPRGNGWIKFQLR